MQQAGINLNSYQGLKLMTEKPPKFTQDESRNQPKSLLGIETKILMLPELKYLIPPELT